jgi:hypothetical protein
MPLVVLRLSWSGGPTQFVGVVPLVLQLTVVTETLTRIVHSPSDFDGTKRLFDIANLPAS